MRGVGEVRGEAWWCEGGKGSAEEEGWEAGHKQFTILGGGLRPHSPHLRLRPGGRRPPGPSIGASAPCKCSYVMNDRMRSMNICDKCSCMLICMIMKSELVG